MEPEFPRDEERPEVGPLTEAYLQRHVHPDDVPEVKAEHGIGKPSGLLFPKAASDPLEDPNAEDIWMYT